MTRVLFIEKSTESEKSTEFVKILNWTVQFINKLIKWLADTDMIYHITNSFDYFINLIFCSCHMNVANNESMLNILIDNIQLTFFLSDDTEKWTLFKNILYCRKTFCNFFSIDCAVLNNVEFKINKKSINFINENSNFIDWADFKNCHFYLHVNKFMSSISTNLAFIAKVSQFISAKLKDAKSVKNSIIDQQQNSDNIIDSFDMSNQLSEASLNEASLNKTWLNEASFNKASLSEASSSKASELSALY